ncbi:hypothetical protein D7S86_28740 [Pararobbsia silviterrae]|uniref:LysR substrate-binding domain-containing protein n=1 Tax=Pararobbsia silviterrae TaxID=1792498 RepID=A0A494WYC5_9BURK|nr:hypothetical protein D7S86_28740 [Pararobbsia silviterrae]
MVCRCRIRRALSPSSKTSGARSRLLLLAKRVIDLSDFAHQAFISLGSNDPYRIQMDDAFARLGIARRLVVETPSAVSVCSLVRKGLGLAIVNPLTALEFADHNLHIRPLSVSFPFRVSLIRPEHRPSNPLVAAFTTSLHAEIAILRRGLN